MKRAITVLNALVGALVMTLVLAVGVLLFLMFTSNADDAVSKTGLFGGVYFETTKTAGGVNGSMGMGNIVPLLVIFAIFFVALLLAQNIYRQLRERRNQLLSQGTATQ